MGLDPRVRTPVQCRAPIVSMGKKNKRKGFQVSGLSWASQQIAALEATQQEEAGEPTHATSNKRHKGNSSLSSFSSSSPSITSSASSSSSLAPRSAHALALDQLRQSGCLQQVFAGISNSDKLFVPLPAGNPISTKKLMFLVLAIRRAVLLSSGGRLRNKKLVSVLCQILLEHMATAERSKSSVRGQKKGYGTTTEYVTLLKTLIKHAKRVRASLHNEMQASNAPIARADRIRALIELDACYYALYYFSVSVKNAKALYTPVVYFGAMEQMLYESKACGCGNMVGRFLYEVLDAAQREVLRSSLGLDEGAFSVEETKQEYACTTAPWRQDKFDNPLLRVLRARWSESVYLFGPEEGEAADDDLVAGMFASFLRDAATNSQPQQLKKKKKKNQMQKDALALNKIQTPALLGAWRDSVRDWMCHVYAYACPNDAAIKEMTKYGPIVELGAGTGYWLSLLASETCAHEVVGLDINPPGHAEGKLANEYHGSVPAHHGAIEQGEATSLAHSRFRLHALFLCYPTPRTSMALDALNQYAGEFVLHVGELVHGDTGDERFLAALQDEFALINRVALPNFSNTAYELTVWKRKSKITYALPPTHLLCCGTCQAAIRRNTTFVRSRLHRGLVWCSSDCMSGSLDATQATLGAQFLCASDDVETANALQGGLVEKLVLP
jgi:hypothetical protein